MRRLRRRTTTLLIQAVVVAAFFLALELVGRSGFFPVTILVPVSTMLGTLTEIAAAGDVLPNLFRTLGEALASFTLACLLGVPFGALLWRFTYLSKAFSPYLVSFYALPMVMFYPVLVLMFGLGSVPVVLLTFITASIPVVLNTMIGLTEMREVYLKVATSFQASPRQTAWKVVLPAVTPYLFAGLRISALYSFSLTISMEFILSDAGLGYAVRYFYEFMRTPVMYAYVIVAVALAVGLNFLLMRGESGLRQESL